MADVLLDAIYEVTRVALKENNMHDQITLLKDHANFRMIIKLKNWAKLIIGDEADSDAELEVRQESRKDNCVRN